MPVSAIHNGWRWDRGNSRLDFYYRGTRIGHLNTSGLTGILGLFSNSATSGIGYTTGAGGAVTQGTSKATGVTLNTICGAITMNNAALAAAAEVGFTVTNSAVAARDVIVLSIQSVATADSYTATVDAVAAGSFRISVGNVSAASLSEAIVINFAVIKAVNA